MHEAGIAQEVLRIIEVNAREHGDGAVRSVLLRVGDLSGVALESLKFALEVFSQGTRAEGVKVEVIRVPASTRCRGCSHEWEYALEKMICPKCGGCELQIEGGREMSVESFEME